MNQYYSNDGGSSWEGPLSEQELEMLRQAGVITDATLLRSDNAAAASAPNQSPPSAAATPPSPESADIYLLILGERRGPFTTDQVREMLSFKQITKATPMWRTGMSEWSTVDALLGNGIIGSNFLSGVTGLGGFEGFSFKHFFGGIFKHHTADEATDFFCSGSSMTTPSLTEINPIWPSPWIFARLVVLSLMLYWGFTYSFEKFANPKMVPGFMFVGNFAIPFCTLILFAELNIQRNISFNRIVTAFLTGGCLSLFFSLLIYEQISVGEAYIAGLVEEPGKLLAAIVLGRKLCDGRVLSGIVIGAAVGAGFAAFESAGYTFEAIVRLLRHIVQENYTSAQIAENDMYDTIKLRALLSPFGHVVWTAITTGAFWLAMGKKDLTQPQHTPFHLDCLADIRFLRIAWIPVLLHMLWNGMIPQLYIAFGELFRLTLGVVAWLVALLLVQQGIKQIKEAKKAQGLM